MVCNLGNLTAIMLHTIQHLYFMFRIMLDSLVSLMVANLHNLAYLGTLTLANLGE